METLRQDLLLGFRMLAKRPGFSFINAMLLTPPGAAGGADRSDDRSSSGLIEFRE
jgi:hypothetical protein